METRLLFPAVALLSIHAGLQVGVVKSLEGRLAPQVGKILQPHEIGLLENPVADAHQLPMLLLANLDGPTRVRIYTMNRKDG
jgi:hypothetical protein